MAKSQNPLFSFDAQGTIAKLLTFRKHGQQTIAETTPHPKDAKTSAQLAWRTMYQLATALWHALSPAEQAIWETLARPRHMTGYNWFMSQALRPNPGIYLPLAGGTMAGNITMANNRITDLPAPVANEEPARKADIVLYIATHAALTATHGATGAIVGTTNSQTLTSKTLIATTNVVEEITTIASSATPTPTGGSLRNFFTVTALAETATFAAPSGTPVNGNKLIIRIKDNATAPAKALSWNAIYRAMEFALPTTTVLSKTLYLGFIYNSADSTWDLVAINQEA